MSEVTNQNSLFSSRFTRTYLVSNTNMSLSNRRERPLGYGEGPRLEHATGPWLAARHNLKDTNLGSLS